MTIGRFIKRLRPFSLAVAAFAVFQPWTFRLHIAYDMSPSLWLLYAGAVVIVVGWLAATYLHDARRARDPRAVDVRYIVSCAVFIAVGAPLIIFYDPIYNHARLALQKSAMEAVANGADQCPAMTACVRDDAERVFFVWGQHDTVRTGVCHDPGGSVVTLARQRQESVAERESEGPAQAFGGHVTIAEPLGGAWYDCSVSTRWVRQTASP